MLNRSVVSVILIAFTALSQAPPPGAAPGRVVDDLTGKGIAGAAVELGRVGTLQVMAQQITDEAGGFRVEKLEPGIYWISARAEGYVAIHGYQQQGAQLEVRAQGGGTVKVTMTAESVIAGRLVTDRGEPISGAQVGAPGGGESWTDGEGRFRLGGLRAGEYPLTAALPEQTRKAMMQIEPGTGRRLGLPEFAHYPGTTDRAGAAQVTVAARSRVEGLEFRLRREHLVRVKGRLSGMSLPEGRVQIRPPGRQFAVIPIEQGPMVRDGEFSTDLYPAGTYEIYVYDRTDFAIDPVFHRELKIPDAEQVDLVVAMPAPGRLTGRVLLPAGATVDKISISKKGEWTGPSARVDAEGRFEFASVPEGPWWIGGFGGPATGRRVEIQSVQQAGRELPDRAFSITAGDNPPLEIVMGLSYKLSGNVVDAAGNPVPSAFVHLRSTRVSSSYQKGNITGDRGNYTVAVGEGEYMVAAWRKPLMGPETRTCPAAQRIKVERDLTGLRIVVCD